MQTFKTVSKALSRGYVTKPKFLVDLENSVDENISKGVLNPRRHPGIVNSKYVALPPNTTEAIKCVIADVPIKNLLKDSLDLINYLKSRHPPPEAKYVSKKKEDIINYLDENHKIDLTDKSDTEIENLNNKRARQIEKLMKEKIYTWKAISYDKYMSLKYLVGRAAPEYSILHKIFTEIKNNHADFKPKSFFDFGSGVGTGIWAMREFWGDSLQEIFTVDTSPDMNDLARLILCGGEESADPPYKNFYQRQFLPATPTIHNVVLSAFTLFELPSTQNRLLTILNLWRKTKDYLIIVEQGTNAGFSLVNEARDFILEYKDGPLAGHVAYPCPHTQECPRYFQDSTPCNFPVRYRKLKLTEKNLEDTDLYSYVVLRKGERPDNSSWPRVVRPVLVRSRHVVCRMCCDDGKLNEVIFTPTKHGKATYQCARNSNWGDRIPVHLTPKEEIPLNTSQVLEEENSFDLNEAPEKEETQPSEK